MFNVPVEQVDSDLRRRAKTINFGIIYGISAFGLATRLGIPRGQAKDYIDQYFKQYAGIKKYMDDTIEFARKHGYVINVFGRKCAVPGINDKNFTLRSFAERAAINAPLQSSASDIIKKAMVALTANQLDCLVLQIHDELLFEVKAEQAEDFAKAIKNTMESVINISVPMIVDVSIGENWGQT